jgi:hypothetical protein
MLTFMTHYQDAGGIKEITLMTKLRIYEMWEVLAIIRVIKLYLLIFHLKP